MQVIYDLSKMPDLKGSVVTDGMFDGVHLGHQRILKQVVEAAKEKSLPSVLLTYWPHPRHILGGKGEKIKLLTSLSEKIKLVEAQGIDFMLVIPFDHTFSQISHPVFVKEILAEGLKVKKLIIGFDHRFGLNRQGDLPYLRMAGQQFGFEIQEIGRQDIEDIAISSTKIRYSIQHFLLESASQFLGRKYSLQGLVVKGDQRGRLIGFPTANLQIDETHKLIPADGVYVSVVEVNGKKWGGMTNIGFRPTVDGNQHKIETHLFGFSGDLYGKEIEVSFVAPLRLEVKFSGLEELKMQLEKDKKAALQVLAEGNLVESLG